MIDRLFCRRKKCLRYNLSQQLCDMLIFSADEREVVFKYLL